MSGSHLHHLLKKNSSNSNFYIFFFIKMIVKFTVVSTFSFSLTLGIGITRISRLKEKMHKYQ